MRTALEVTNRRRQPLLTGGTRAVRFHPTGRLEDEVKRSQASTKARPATARKTRLQQTDLEAVHGGAVHDLVIGGTKYDL